MTMQQLAPPMEQSHPRSGCLARVVVVAVPPVLVSAPEKGRLHSGWFAMGKERSCEHRMATGVLRTAGRCENPVRLFITFDRQCFLDDDAPDA